jgi:glyoxylase-like metal-dependent hydrolase (beta-lactamase superfamily II)
MAGLRPVTPDRWLEDGDVLSLGEQSFAVLHVPGHAPGHVVFFHAPTRFLVAGDTLFQGSIGRTDLPGGDHALLLAGIHGKILPLGDDVTFLPGHGPASTLGAERAGNPFLQE